VLFLHLCIKFYCSKTFPPSSGLLALQKKIISIDFFFIQGDIFRRLRKATISFVMSVRLSAWNYSASTGRIFTKLYIRRFFRKSVEKIQVTLKSNNNNRYFT